jgi:methyltransferase-like protein
MNTESAEQSLAQAYDRTPYAGQPFCLTHPSLLAAYGCQYGLSPLPPGNSRVLEMGCGDGSNIMPMAYEFPGSQFLGIDLSPVQIGIGQGHVDSLGLMNIRLDARNIMDMGPSDGKFDYIIVHGVYSWVPDRVKEKILDICRNNLADQGIAYISYNVLPGWQFNKSMRDMMLYRSRHISNPKERVNATMELVNTMLEAGADSNRFHDVQLRWFGKNLQSFKDGSSYLLHEYMEANNDPFYFHQFANALGKQDLQYLCDAEQADFELDGLPSDTAKKIEQLSENAIDIEQYLDFFKNTRFRHSLVCHEEIDVRSKYSLERMKPLFAATNVVPVLDSQDSAISEATAFRTSAGLQFSTQHGIAQAVLVKLSQIKPCTIDIPSLIQAVKNELPQEAEGPAEQHEKIGHVVHSLFFNGVVELLAVPRRCVLETRDRPIASSVARLLAPSGRVTNLCHRSIVMDDDMAGFVLVSLDGTRSRDGLIDLALDGIRTGRIHLPNQKAGSKAISREWVGKAVDSILQHLSRCGIMVDG